MEKTKKVTITMTEETRQKARSLSVDLLGSNNLSGVITYLINKADKENKF